LIISGRGDDPSFFINFNQGSRQEIPKDRSCFSTSPNSVWLVYCQDSKNPTENGSLVVENANGREMARLPIDSNWFFSNPDWLDDQHLMFNLWKDKSKPPSSILPVEIINPFTGEKLELASDYPDLIPSGMGPDGNTMYFVNSTVVYRPSLDLVVYPKTPPGSAFVVLWDRKANREVASVKTLGFGYGHAPVWSPDGDQFVVAIVIKNNGWGNGYSEFVSEWFSVNQEGKVQQLTHFGDYFSYVEIGNAKWSPDGKRLAFWITTQPDLCGEGEHLAALEMETWQVTNYCITGVVGTGGPPPIWSPDSRYVAFNSFDSGNHRVVIVDLVQGWAAQIAGDYYPNGWLATP
jgi:Tol biopolymer transport system component